MTVTIQVTWLAGWDVMCLRQDLRRRCRQGWLAGWGFFWFLDGDDDVAGVGMWDGKLPHRLSVNTWLKDECMCVAGWV